MLSKKRHARGRALSFTLAAAAVAALTACGGGGGSSADTNNPPAASTTRFTGVAAKGAALAGATVQAKCAVGSASGITAANGSYTLELGNAALPCVLSAVSADGLTRLHSMADPQGGSPQTIQINPVTELMVARVAQGEAAGFFAGFDAAAQAKLTGAAFTQAADAIVALLKEGGVDLSALGNPVRAALVPATPQAPGNAYDQALDALAARLTQSGLTLQQFAAVVVAQGAPQTSEAASLPAAALLRPAHADCPALRSGKYRVLSPSDTPANLVRLVQLDAPTGTMTWPDNSTSTMTSTGGCTFRSAKDQTRWVVSPAGVGVGVSFKGPNTSSMSIGFPEQAAGLADLQGDWNWTNFFEVNAPATGLRAMDMGTVSINGTGRVTAINNCRMLRPCTPYPDTPNISLNGSGGFDAPGSARLFVYRPGNGDVAMFWIDGQELMVGSKVRTLPLPALGDSWHRMSAQVNPQMQANDGFDFRSYTVAERDAGAQTYVRRAAQDGARQTFNINTPRAGVNYRPAGSTVLNDGSTSTFGDLYVLPLGGTGVLAYGRQTEDNQRNLGSFGFTVDVPAAAAGGVGSVR